MATVITTLAQLQSACQNGGDYALGANISGVAVTIPSGVTLTLDLRTYSLTGTTSNCVIYNLGTLTLRGTTGSIKGGYGRTINEQTFGGGIFNQGTMYMYGGNISGNRATNGGGIYAAWDYAVTYLYGGNISNNTATYAGGFGCDHTTVIAGQNIVISGNTASTGGGGGFYIGIGATGNLQGGEIKNNTAAWGGGVLCGGKLTISGGTISGNVATTSGGGGLDVTNEGTGVTMSGGTISGNHATNLGGAVRLELNAHFTMTGGSISNNYCTNSSGVYGAGIFINTPSSGTTPDNFTMSGGVISGNYGCDYGGGVCVGDNTGASVGFIMTGGEIKNNTARVSGAGVYCDNYSYFKVSGTPVVMDNKVSSTQNNVYLSSNSRLTLTGSLTGGEVYIKNPLGKGSQFGVTESASYTGANRLLGDDGLYQGEISGTSLIWVDAQRVKIPVNVNGVWKDAVPSVNVNGVWKGVVGIWANVNNVWKKVAPITLITTRAQLTDLCTNGGSGTLGSNISGVAVTIPSGKSVTLDLGTYTLTGTETDSVIKVNGDLILNGTTGSITGGGSDSWSYGGGVSVSGGTFTMNGGVITGNKSNPSGMAAEGHGGGVSVFNSGTFTMAGGSITGNTAAGNSGGYGGGVHIGPGCTFNMVAGTISGNTASYYGGGVHIIGGTCIMTSGTISGNTATEFVGGGVYVGNNSSYNGTFTMNSGSITRNRAYYASGVCFGGSTFTMNGGSITNNTSTSYYDGGGGVYLSGSGTFNLNGGSITGNSSSSSSRKGGGVYVGSGVFNIKGPSVISGNTNSGVADNISLSSSKYINLSGNFTGTAYVTNPVGAGVKFGTNTGGYTGVGNFLSDTGGFVGTMSGTNMVWASAYQPQKSE